MITITKAILNVPVFGNMIYHDNEHAQYCYRGHFEKHYTFVCIA